MNSYNLARDSWLAYRAAISTSAPTAVYLSELNQNLTDLAMRIQHLEEVQ